MKIEKFDSNDLWLEARRGKITGSRLGDVIVKRGTGEKAAFYELIAEKMAKPADGENPMDRGHRLEDEAITRFEAETGKEVCRDLVMFRREDQEDIAVSPDGYITPKDGEPIKECVEVKCLASWAHIKTLLESMASVDKTFLPSDFREQYAQYFVVNDSLETLYAVFYDPRMIARDFFFLTVKRTDFNEDEISGYLELERQKLGKVAETVNDLCKGTDLDF